MGRIVQPQPTSWLGGQQWPQGYHTPPLWGGSSSHLPLHTPPRARTQALLPTEHLSPAVPPRPGSSLQRAAKGCWDELAGLWMPAQAGQGRYEPVAGRISQCLPVSRCSFQKARWKERPGRKGHFPATATSSLVQCCTGKLSTALPARRLENPLAASGWYFCHPASSGRPQSAQGREDTVSESSSHQPWWTPFNHRKPSLAPLPVIWGFAPNRAKEHPG